MDEIEVKGLEIDGKKFILIESIDKYRFLVDENDFENICILKSITKEEQNYLENVDDNEFDEALKLYYEKFKNTNS